MIETQYEIEFEDDELVITERFACPVGGGSVHRPLLEFLEEVGVGVTLAVGLAQRSRVRPDGYGGDEVVYLNKCWVDGCNEKVDVEDDLGLCPRCVLSLRRAVQLGHDTEEVA